MTAAASAPHQGRIIMFDGPDGAGKTTQLGLVADKLQQAGKKVHLNRVNGGTAIGEALRVAYLDPRLDRPPETDLFIILAMHAALAQELLELRKNGIICLVDRSPLAIMAYQVAGSGLDSAKGKQATEASLELFDADLILCYDAPIETLAAHKQQRSESENNNFFENKPDDYIQRVIDGYHTAAKTYGAPVINAGQSLSAVHADTMKLLQPFIA